MMSFSHIDSEREASGAELTDAYVCCYYLTSVKDCIIGSFMTTPAKRKALLASGTLNPHPEAVRSELFQMDFFDPHDLAQVKYEMLRAHSVDDDPLLKYAADSGSAVKAFIKFNGLSLSWGSVLSYREKEAARARSSSRAKYWSSPSQSKKRIPISIQVDWPL